MIKMLTLCFSLLGLFADARASTKLDWPEEIGFRVPTKGREMKNFQTYHDLETTWDVTLTDDKNESHTLSMRTSLAFRTYSDTENHYYVIKDKFFYMTVNKALRKQLKDPKAYAKVLNKLTLTKAVLNEKILFDDIYDIGNKDYSPYIVDNQKSLAMTIG